MREIPRRQFLRRSGVILTGIHLVQTRFALPNRRTVRFGLCADVHKDLIHDADSRLQYFVDNMAEQELDFVMQLGDFCTPHDRNRGFLHVWNSYEGDKFHVLGNHDVDGGFSWDQTMRFYGMDTPFYSFDRGGFHFVVLDGNNKPDWHESGYPAYISREQIDWLESDLSKATGPTLVFSHQSLTDACGGHVENFADVQSVLENARWNSGENKVIASINGHTHLDYASLSNNIHYLSLNSMAYFWMGADYQHSHYGGFIEQVHPALRYTVPYDAPLYAVVSIDPKGEILVEGQSARFVPPTPRELGRDDERITAKILDRKLRFAPAPAIPGSSKTE